MWLGWVSLSLLLIGQIYPRFLATWPFPWGAHDIIVGFTRSEWAVEQDDRVQNTLRSDFLSLLLNSMLEANTRTSSHSGEEIHKGVNLDAEITGPSIFGALRSLVSHPIPLQFGSFCKRKALIQPVLRILQWKDALIWCLQGNFLIFKSLSLSPVLVT